MKKEIDVIIVKRLTRDTITLELRTIEDDVAVFDEIIGCRCIDIVGRYFNNKHFDVVLDDEGLLVANEKRDLPTSWWQHEGYTPNYEGLFGTLLLCHCDEEGNLTSATAEDLIDVQSCYKVINAKNGDEIALLFHDVEERS